MLRYPEHWTLLSNPNVHYRVHNSPPRTSNLSQMDPVLFIYLTLILILSSHLCLGHPRDFCPYYLEINCRVETLTFQLINFLSIFRCLGRSKNPFMSGVPRNAVTCCIFITGCYTPRQIPCRVSVTAYSTYSQLSSVCVGLAMTRQAAVTGYRSTNQHGSNL
jgi:hypothetical protein